MKQQAVLVKQIQVSMLWGAARKKSILQEDPHSFVVELRKSKKRSAWRIDSSMPSEIAEVCGRGAPHFHVGRVCAFEIFPTPHEDHDAPEKSRFKFFEGDLKITFQ